MSAAPCSHPTFQRNSSIKKKKTKITTITKISLAQLDKNQHANQQFWNKKPIVRQRRHLSTPGVTSASSLSASKKGALLLNLCTAANLANISPGGKEQQTDDGGHLKRINQRLRKMAASLRKRTICSAVRRE